MVKLEKKIASKKPSEGKLQKQLKTKNKKEKVVVKEVNLIKKAAESELVKNVDLQNGKAGKKIKAESTAATKKKNKKDKQITPQVIESPPPAVSKKDKKKAVDVASVVPEEVKPIKNKKSKKENVDPTPAKKSKQKKVAEPQEVVSQPEEQKPVKKAKKVKADPASVVDVPAKKTKTLKNVPVLQELVAPLKKGKKVQKIVEHVPIDQVPSIKSEVLSKKGKKAVKVPENKLEAPVKQEESQATTKKGKKVKLEANVSSKKGGKPALVSTEAPVSKKSKKQAVVEVAQNGKPAKSTNLQQNGKAEKIGKKVKNPVESVETFDDAEKKVFEAPPFNEDDFNNILTHENIKKVVKGLTKIVKKETENKKQIFSDYRYLLDVSAHKIANCPKRMVKLLLKHPIPQPNEDDIVLFVPDLQRGRKVDYEPTIQHYEDILRRNNIEGVKVISFNQLKNEYNSYELRRKLANSYEHFLCDGRIVSHVVGFLGVITQKPRTSLHAVHMEHHNNIGASIRKGIRRTAFKQLNKGSMTTIPIASHRHTAEEVADNILAVLRQLKGIYPGGLGNIRSLNIKVTVVGTSSLPLYLSMVQGPDTNPYVVGPREQKMLKLKRETKDVLSKFQFTNEGTIQRLTQEQIAKKRKIQEGKAGEAVSEEVKAKKIKKEKKKKNKEETTETPKEEKVVEEEKIEELVRLEEEDDSEDEDAIVELVHEGEELDDDDEEEDDDSDDDSEDDDE